MKTQILAVEVDAVAGCDDITTRVGNECVGVKLELEKNRSAQCVCVSGEKALPLLAACWLVVAHVEEL